MDQLLPPPHRLTRRIALILGIPFLLALGFLTLWPQRVEDSMPVLLDRVLGFLRDDLAWTWMGFSTLEVLANILVFIPVGILAFVFAPRRIWPVAFLVGPLVSIAIELVQGIALPERASTVADVIANSAGATIGVGVALLCTLLASSMSSTPATPGPVPSLSPEAP
ncbi:MAG: VanZ family protein [Actinomycetota bacterium]